MVFEVPMRPGLLQLCPFPPSVEAALAARFALTRWPEIRDEAQWLTDHAGGIQAIATSGHVGVPAALLQALPALELIAVNGVGYDRIDLELAQARGIRIANTPDVLTDDVADLAIGLMIAAARTLPGADAFVRLGGWPEAALPLGRTISRKRYGLLGLGRIGSAIARRLEGFGGEIAYVARSAKPVAYRRFDTPLELARHSDVFIVASSAAAADAPIVDRAVIEAVGPQGLLINIARGGLVDEAELIAALKDGRLGAAALDVFANEPFVPDALRQAPNVVLTPHIGSATTETRQAMGELLLANLDAWLTGQPLLTPVA
jgi:lactate dehydrogenase-like 2-hydroxyacid dehydrogenase